VKRKRPNSLLAKIHLPKPYFGDVIPPCSVVKVTAAQWDNDLGRVFRIGYYSRQDGLDCVWLVNESGEYEQTTDQESITKDFQVLTRTEESDFYGTNREVLGPISTDELLKLGGA
jgi:hypothetical protein